MRDYFLVLAVLIYLGMTMIRPFSGVLLWGWFTIMNPHQEAYGFARTFPFNAIIAVLTMGAWMMSKEPKLPRYNIIYPLIFIFIVWITINSFFAVLPSWSWPLWDRTWKIYAFGIIAATLTLNKNRFHSLMWIVVISIGYYSFKGGVFTLMTGGNYHVFGPPSTIIGDNNQLALAVVMTLPFMNYLYFNSERIYVRFILIFGGIFSVITVLGSYSRGGVIALSALAVMFWLRSRRKVVSLLALAAFGGPALLFMPDSFYERVHSIVNYNQDASVIGRFDAWKVAYFYARDHFPFGAGFAGPQLNFVFDYYLPGAENHAAHSIYFQVLGENGFVGLFIYLLILMFAYFNIIWIIRRSRGVDGLEWAHDLGWAMLLSMASFCIGGAALSMAYYDIFILIICLSGALRTLVSLSLDQASTQSTSSQPHNPRKAIV